MNISNLTAPQLRHAADIKEKIETLRTELAEIFGEPTRVQANGAPRRYGAGRKWTAAHRAKFNATMKERRYRHA